MNISVMKNYDQLTRRREDLRDFTVRLRAAIQAAGNTSGRTRVEIVARKLDISVETARALLEANTPAECGGEA